jgi:S1-C subfamily serine protease
VQSSAAVGGTAWGGGVFDAFGNLIGITTNRSTGAQAINTSIAIEEFFH